MYIYWFITIYSHDKFLKIINVPRFLLKFGEHPLIFFQSTLKARKKMSENSNGIKYTYFNNRGGKLLVPIVVKKLNPSLDVFIIS
jgi:hypothetical protein